MGEGDELRVKEEVGVVLRKSCEFFFACVEFEVFVGKYMEMVSR